MSGKARVLGNVARQNVTAADNHLANADRVLEPQSRGEVARPELVASKARFGIAEARRLLEKTLGLGSTEPLSQEKP